MDGNATFVGLRMQLHSNVGAERSASAASLEATESDLGNRTNVRSETTINAAREGNA